MHHFCGFSMLFLVVGVVVQDKKVLVLIFESNDLQVLILALEEANHSKVGFGANIDRCNLMPIQTKMGGVLHNCILQQENGLKSSKSSFGNQLRLHIAKKHSGIFLFEAEV